MGRRASLHPLALSLLLLAVATAAIPAARAQMVADHTVAGDRILLSGSIRPIATDAASAGKHQAALVRSTLTADELASGLTVEVSLRMRDFDKLQQRLAAQETLAPGELKEKYAPLDADRDALAKWLQAQGLSVVKSDKHNLAVFARGTVAQVQSAFQTRFALVSFEGKSYLSATSVPSVPASLPNVLGVTGLQTYQHSHVHMQKPSGAGQSSASGVKPAINNQPPYLVSEILGAFDATGNGLTGSGQEIGIIIDALPSADDLTDFWADNSVNQTLDNIFYEEDQVSSRTPDTASGEETLDTEWSSAIAPAATEIIFVTGTLYNEDTDGTYSAVCDDLSANDYPDLHQISMSYGGYEDEDPDSSIQTDEQYFATIASYGVTIFASTGDNGAFDDKGNLSVEYPSSDPNITGVGGVSIVLNPSTGAVSSETGWSADAKGFNDGRIAASTGGYSRLPRPSWQKGTGVPSGNTRVLPDVAASSDQDEPGLLVLNGQAEGGANGTSWASPTWVGLCALLNEARANAGAATVGLLGPKIYPLIGSNAFRDITVGSNGHHDESDGYACTPGYDLVTGIGTPYFNNLLTTLTAAAPKITSFSPTSGAVGSTVVLKGTGFVPPLSVTFGGNVSASGSFTSTQLTVTVPSGAQTGKITVKTANGSASTASNFTVTAAVAKPVISSAATATATVGKAFSYQITASNDPTKYGVGGLIAGFKVDTTTGKLTGTATSAQVGNHTFTLQAANAGGTGTKTLTLTVKAAPPAITSAATATATIGKAFTYQITATGSPTRYGVGGLFGGLKVDTSTGKITGTLTNSAGTHSLTLEAANASGTGTKTLTLTVKSQ